MLWHGPSILFLANSKRLSRHPSTDAWHSPWARILLRFPCFECVSHGVLEGPFVACFGTVLLLLLAVSKRLFREPFTDAWHSPWARILLGFPCFACVPHGALEGPFVACFGTVLLLLLAASKRLFRHPSTDAWHSPWARILLGFPCFACVPHGALEGPFVACFGTVLLFCF